MYGWTGRLLEVDLSSGSVGDFELPERYLHTLLGGANLGARLLWDFKTYQANPLGPENVLLFLTGPVSGTLFPGAGRVHIMARSPLTGLWGESSLGGFLAVPIKLAGYDGIMIRGRAGQPVYLEMKGDEKRLVEAADLWGLDAFQTEDELRRRCAGARVEIAAIGPAGERQTPLASIVHRKQNFAARTGMGAVMGSKNLKAIVVHGSGNVAAADPEAFAALTKACREALKTDFWSNRRKQWGTIGNLEWAVDNRRTPSKNWQNPDWRAQAKAITGETLANTYLTGRSTCHGCPIVCKRKVEVGSPPFNVEEGAGPEYETAAGLGSMLLNDNLPALLKVNDLCNRLGLDTISVGSTIAWAMEAYDRGLLDEQWTGGQPLEWGDAEAIVRVVEDIGRRTGLGALLSRGSAAAARTVGQGSEAFAMQVKGLEIAYHHPRAARGMEITYATNPRGGTHMESPDVFEFLNAADEVWVREIARTVDRSTLPNAYVVCSFIPTTMGLPFMSRLMAALTGEDWGEDRLIQAAERGWYLKRMFNLRCGAGRESDTLPLRIQQQLVDAGCDHSDFERILQLYLDQRGLDASGLPDAGRLRSLGLDDLAS